MRGAAAAILLALTLAGCGADPGASTAPAKRFPVEAVAAVAEPELRSVSAPASLAPRETVRLTARVSGIIDRILVQQGDRVTAGQVVAEIDAARYRLAVDGALAQLARASAARDDALAQRRRREQAAKEQPGLISDDDLARVRAQAAQAEAEVGAAEAALRRAELDLAEASVTSPLAGVIQERLAETGQPASPGTAIATLIDRSRVLLHAQVPVGEAAVLRPGLTVSFRLDGEAGERSAVLTLVGEAADPTSRLVPIMAQVADADAAEVRPGAFAMLRIDLPAGAARILVPDLAVRPSARGFLLYVVEGQGDTAVARERRVTLGGRTRDGRIAIADGLSVGERVVTRGADALRDGAPLALGAPSGK